MKPEYWIINTDFKDDNERPMGPFKNQAEAEKHLAKSCAQTWVEACGCLRKREPGDTDWCLPYLIVKAVRRVVPEFTATAILKDV